MVGFLTGPSPTASAMSNLSFNYSKWDRLEISDDEDTFHPNLDKGLNIRVNRITRDRKEEEIDEEKKKLEAKGEFEKAQKLESKRPLHVNNLCHVAEERTIINSSDGSVSDKTKRGEESFSVDEFSQFKNDNKALLDKFENADWETSHGLLREYGDILMDGYANSYYMLTALDEEMAGNRARMERLARQGQIISQICQLAEPMKRPPRDLIPRFFERFDRPESKRAFQEGVDHFVKQLARRAIDKKREREEEARQRMEEDAEPPSEEDLQPVPLVEAMYSMSKEDRMGPGGLDPVEVFESISPELQECFRTGDIEMLKKVMMQLTPEESKAQFQRCVDAGLWTPSL